VNRVASRQKQPEALYFGMLMTEGLLPAPRAILEQYPITDEESLRIFDWRNTVCNILSKEDPRPLIIIGPCAVHRADATLDYASRLAEMAAKFSDKLCIVMRTYIEKARSGVDWNGFLYSFTNEDGTASLRQGIIEARKLLLSIVRLNLPIAMEFVEPLAADYFSDLVTWGSIGARTVHSPIHRQLASRLPLPIGCKNSLDGSIEASIQAVLFANQPHNIFGINMNGHLSEIYCPGNPYAHLVLRGGESGANYHRTHVLETAERLSSLGLPDSLVVDCSHGNSERQFERQPAIFQYLLDTFLSDPLSPVRGMMVESFLIESTQEQLLLDGASDAEKCCIEYGSSMVDGCLNWASTVELLVDAYERCQKHSTVSARGIV
jgi:3-deoxy-7-phosphoheptulonate synthase